MTPFRLLAILLFLTPLASSPLAAQAPEFPRTPPARVMLGGAEVTDPERVLNPGGMAVDPATGKVFVSDTPRHRVLRFADYRTLTEGAAAEAVLGQPDFTTFAEGAGPGNLSFPGGLCVDAAGRLWVADSRNHRVLRFDNASSLASGSPAGGVLGQPGFGTANPGLSAAAMNFPFGVFADEAGRLWVSDSQNHRVLRFDNAAIKPNGVAANAVLGQPDFTTALAADPPAATSMNSPAGLVVQPGGRLWVADAMNHRVLRFDNAPGLSGGAAASGVLGQPGFTSRTPSAAAAGLNVPAAVGFDAHGGLWVADNGNARLVRFDDPETLPPGAAAAALLGQEDWGAGGTGALSRSFAFFHAEDDSLWVADAIDESRGRVLQYAPLLFVPAACGLDGQGRFFLRFPSRPLEAYRIETSADLRQWSVLDTVTASAAETLWTQAQPSAGRRFFRVLRQP